MAADAENTVVKALKCCDFAITVDGSNDSGSQMYPIVATKADCFVCRNSMERPPAERLGTLFWMYPNRVVAVSQFEGLLTTLCGYVLLGVVLVFLHGLAALVKLRRTQRLLGLCYVVVKVALLSVVEIGLFPLSMLDATLSDRESSFQLAPGTFMFLHWLVGMVYVFYFASFVLLLREVLRPGLLWFLRNLNDPDFNPIQEMIHLPILQHVRRFLVSLVIFGTTVLLMVWVPVRLIQFLLPGFLPYHVLISSESPSQEISLELILLQVVLPTLLEQGHMKQWLKALVRAWCVGVACLLDLRSYLLGDAPDTQREQVEATTVQNCFKRAGFSVCAGDADDSSDTIDQTSDIVDDACETLLAEVLERQGVTEGISFPDFRDADSDVQTSPDMSDEAIVASVVEVSPNDSDEDDMESDNTGDPGPTVAEAAHCVSVMRVFAEKRGLAEKLARSISQSCAFAAVDVAVVSGKLQCQEPDGNAEGGQHAGDGSQLMGPLNEVDEEVDDEEDEDEEDDEEEAGAAPVVLGAAHQALLQGPGPSAFQAYQRPRWFPLRLAALLCCIAFSLTALSFAMLTVPGCRVQAVLHARPRLIFATSYGSALHDDVVAQAQLRSSGPHGYTGQPRTPTFMQRGSSSRRRRRSGRGFTVSRRQGWSVSRDYGAGDHHANHAL
ncbi:hypothetical protein HPB50_016398 [Hyalomma asiaticum]|uniref:Uncharacterized protein n=1 Tax=Hyalomma asiaticum TaxID=266040 RepID=A0ACB7TJ95_HYAAI|nr:hypothetical protein HPB50_016398 [Hyalomma asiaticum]